MSEEELDAIERASIDEAWRSGNLNYKLHSLQREIVDRLRATLARDERRFVVEAGRKVGKTYLLVVLACEMALRKPKSRIVYGAPTLKHLEEFVHPEFNAVSDDAPEGLAPKWNGGDSHYEFHNGSWIHLFGAKDEYQAKNGRGPGAVAAFFDEAAFCEVLPTVLDGVFKPSLQANRLTGKEAGFQVLSSSPADIPEHPFTAITEIEEARDNYAHASWLENPMLNDEDRAKEIAENAAQAGMSVEDYIRSAKYRREYLGERVVDPSLVGFPEWEELRKTRLAVVERPALYRGQEGIDFGGVDPHFIVFGYWHAGKGLVIEDELVLRDGETTLQLADAVKEKEKDLWGVNVWDGTLEGLSQQTLFKFFGEHIPTWATDAASKRHAGQPWMRSRDTDTQLGIDLYAQGLLTVPTRKDNKQLAVDSLRVLMRKGQLWVHPRCVRLDRDLRATTWANEKREQWARRADGSHGDGCDALVYLNRNLERDVPLEPSTLLRLPSVASPLLGDSPMARRLLARRR